MAGKFYLLKIAGGLILVIMLKTLLAVSVTHLSYPLILLQSDDVKLLLVVEEGRGYLKLAKFSTVNGCSDDISFLRHLVEKDSVSKKELNRHK